MNLTSLRLTFIFITSEEEEKVEEERVKSQADQVKVKSVIELAGSFSPLLLFKAGYEAKVRRKKGIHFSGGHWTRKEDKWCVHIVKCTTTTTKMLLDKAVHQRFFGA